MKRLSELEYNKKFRIMDLNQILFNVLKKTTMLIDFYWSNKSWEEIEEMTNTHYHVFTPRMEPWFSYLPGTSKKIDYHFLQISNEFRREMKSEQIDVKKGNTKNE